MSIDMEVGLGAGDFVLDGDPAPRKKGTAPPNFWPMSIVAKRLDESKMRLDVEVDLGPGDVVLDGIPAPPYKGHSPPVFGPWLDGWIHHLVRK